jgi:hypothetical protein
MHNRVLVLGLQIPFGNLAAEWAHYAPTRIPAREQIHALIGSSKKSLGTKILEMGCRPIPAA